MTILNPDTRIRTKNRVEPVCLKKPKRSFSPSRNQFRIPMIVITMVIIIPAVILPGIDNSRSWVNKKPMISPPKQTPSVLMYHPPTDKVIMFGGQYEIGIAGGEGKSYESIWTYSIKQNNWTNETPSKTSWASPKMAYEMVYDSKNDIFIIFGGDNQDSSTSGETWAFDYTEGTWRNMTPSLSPPKRIFHSLTYDSQSEQIIMYGGLSSFLLPNIFYQDIWTYDYLKNTWVNMTPTRNPPARAKADIVYDEKADRILVFGGFTEKPSDWTHDGFKQDLWSFDLESRVWTELTPEKSPSERAYHKMVYNTKTNQMILYGGVKDKNYGEVEVYQDTWTYKYDTNKWTKVTTADLPPARWNHGMIYENKSNQIILFGGFTAPGYYFLGDTWTLKDSTTKIEINVILRNIFHLLMIVGVSVVILIPIRVKRMLKK